MTATLSINTQKIAVSQQLYQVLQLKMIMWYTVVALAILAAPLIMAQDDTCTRYGFDIDLPGASCADIYNKILPAMVDLVTMFSKLIISSLPTVIWN